MREPTGLLPRSLDRTYEELKPRRIRRSAFNGLSLDRTYEELKHNIRSGRNQTYPGLDRTYEELKQ